MFFNSLKNVSIYNLTDYNLDKEIKVIKRVLKRTLKNENVFNACFSVIIVDDSYIHKINKEYRKIDRPTDVISFALLDNDIDNLSDLLRLGDIYISIDRVRKQALDYGHSNTREIAFLAVHGLLHLLGYDHMNKEDEKIMFGKQELILNEEKVTR